MKPHILVVDNDSDMLGLLREHLEGERWRVTAVTTGAEACAALAQEEFAVVLTDLVMEPVDGLAVLREAHRLHPGTHVIVMTAYASVESAIHAMREGAYDYVTKPFNLSELTLVARRALEEHRLRDENRRLREEVQRRYSFNNILGRSKAMQAVFDQIRAVAESDASVFLIGPSGSGKELVARAIHFNSGRKAGPFVAVNCGAIPETLLESELFGHERGAFTGADRRRRGLVVEAQGGTLFLDEISEMPLSLQVKLLRVLQDHVVRPIGGNDEMRVDFRVISATNRDLPSFVRQGRFREDLYYRMAVIPIHIPSLRERPEDIPLLAEHFLERSSTSLRKHVEGFDEVAAKWLLSHRWPGNVRELENVVERAATLARGPLITQEDLRVDLAPGPLEEPGVRPTLAELEIQYIRRVLAETKGDKRRAAEILGISVRTLQRMQAMSKLGEAALSDRALSDRAS
ncbi:MAG TPA: sigma-54 dependent transcriptional regulator [Methylomirabilota bacterium]|jgi:DNA-binding NtrC family response regulator|nr:sigma-54 dependent transcriptional regulator [Methylomirabilota bacterium]